MDPECDSGQSFTTEPHLNAASSRLLASFSALSRCLERRCLKRQCLRLRRGGSCIHPPMHPFVDLITLTESTYLLTYLPFHWKRCRPKWLKCWIHASHVTHCTLCGDLVKPAAYGQVREYVEEEGKTRARKGSPTAFSIAIYCHARPSYCCQQVRLFIPESGLVPDSAGAPPSSSSAPYARLEFPTCSHTYSRFFLLVLRRLAEYRVQKVRILIGRSMRRAVLHPGYLYFPFSLRNTTSQALR